MSHLTKDTLLQLMLLLPCVVNLASPYIIIIIPVKLEFYRKFEGIEKISATNVLDFPCGRNGVLRFQSFYEELLSLR